MSSLDIYIDVILYKVKSIFNSKWCFSANVFKSQVSGKASLRQNVRFYNSTLGDYSYIGRNCLLQNVEIGKFCSISDNCNIGMPMHPVSFVSTSPVFLRGKNVLKTNFSELVFVQSQKTIIGNDVWIGDGVKIKRGVNVGDGAIIGAGAIVTSDVEPYSIVVGVPAKLLKKRFSEDVIEKLLILKWWNFDEAKLVKLSKYFESPELLEKYLNSYK